MIPTPYHFEAKLAPEEFQKIGQFACRWSHIEHTMGNCLRRLLDLSPKQATSLIFPMTFDTKMNRIKALAKSPPLTSDQVSLFNELDGLVHAIRYIRNATLHGIVIALGQDEPYFHLRTKQTTLTKDDLFGCEDLINYTAHLSVAFRASLGDKDVDPEAPSTLPGRPPIPAFLPENLQQRLQKGAAARNATTRP